MATGMGIAAIGNWMSKKGQCSRNCTYCAVAFQLCADYVHSAWLPEHYLKDVHHFWHYVLPWSSAIIPDILGNGWQESRENRASLYGQNQAVEHQARSFKAG